MALLKERSLKLWLLVCHCTPDRLDCNVEELWKHFSCFTTLPFLWEYEPRYSHLQQCSICCARTLDFELSLMRFWCFFVSLVIDKQNIKISQDFGVPVQQGSSFVVSTCHFHCSVSSSDLPVAVEELLTYYLELTGQPHIKLEPCSCWQQQLKDCHCCPTFLSAAPHFCLLL